MISTRRIVAAVGLAAGITGLTVPMANAADVDARNAGSLNPVATLDSLAATGIPEEHKHRVPRVSQHLGHLNHLNGLKQLP
ncbi:MULTISPECIES: hypothetical protein [unclassified Streptomyces]|uniref:hypothetical protein n=1 Tax=unclassified Streptomyces TaxID=2593676 RepID=UPI0023654C95|nr:MULTISPECIES: hypothetical protein [unclassified Streptomyces]MDF3146995.1 hypothetical protein [Streptomyces sp. T21Q-yed]WDF35516.1 hypothetical protein PBV52_01205 [Streptomyces sp. T12]